MITKIINFFTAVLKILFAGLFISAQLGAVMGVEIAQQQPVSVADDVDERRDVEVVVCRAGGRRRDVGIRDNERRAVDNCADDDVF